jgi:nitrogen fixation/metabolism regulation signal transduction histidine kinase
VVLEIAVKVLSNPIVLRMLLLLFASGFLFFMAVLMIRRMRRSLGENVPAAPSLDQLPMHMYTAVIQQLKQQKHELQTQQQAEHRRARTSENLSAAILSNLSSGVLFFGVNGLVKQANQSAKRILGIASPAGMNAEQIFREASLVCREQGVTSPGEAIQRVLASGTALKRAEMYYVTPGGEARSIELTVSGVKSLEGGMLGIACLLEDQSAVEDLRREMELHGELSAEMALSLRNSLVTISGYAQQLASNRDPGLAQQLASDIAEEASQLDRTIGGFLAGSRKTQAASNGL